jgi:1-deoxy-D-xylulose-5-phosphate synthase
MVLSSMAAAEQLDAEGIHCTVVNCRFLKPYDRDVFEEMVRSHPTVVTLEEGQVSNGFGAYMAREIADLELETSPRIGTLGVPDRFIQHGGREELLVEIGLDVAGISAQVRNIVARGVTLEPV